MMPVEERVAMAAQILAQGIIRLLDAESDLTQAGSSPEAGPASGGEHEPGRPLLRLVQTGGGER